MNAPIPLKEFAALVGTSPEQVEQWRREGLLDPAGLGRFDELDLVRWLAIHSHEARGYRSDQLAAAIGAGEVHPFMGEFLFPSARTLTLDEAAERAGVETEMVRELRTALGLSRDGGVAETWLAQLEAFKTMQAAGLPWEAVLEGARVYGDALRRLAETEVRLVHVHVHERLSASGMAEDEVLRQLGVIEEAVVPLLDGIVRAVHHEHLLQASIEDAYLHLPSSELPAERGSVETTIVFLDLESFTELTHTKGDEGAMQTLTRLEGVVRPLALDHDGKLVKQIGDGVMLAFRRPDEAVAFARQALDAGCRRPRHPSAARRYPRGSRDLPLRRLHRQHRQRRLARDRDKLRRRDPAHGRCRVHPGGRRDRTRRCADAARRRSAGATLPDRQTRGTARPGLQRDRR